MSAQTVITHAQSQGVTLRKPVSPTMQVNANDAWRALGDDIAPGLWWGIPVYVIREWITDALREGDYRTASAYSALIPREPLVKAPTGDVIRPAVIIGGHPVWDVVWASPRPAIQEWILEALREGDYASASELSGALHGPVPALPEGVKVLR